MMRHFNWPHILSLPLAALLFLHGATAAAELAPERSVKAAFLSRFIGFAEFPGTGGAPASGPITIGVYGADDVAAELSRVVSGKLLNQRPILVRNLGPREELSGLHMLFIGGDLDDHAEHMLAAAAKQGILTVTEVDGGLRSGSVINFRLVDERVRFEVSREAAQRSRIVLSSRLLSVAYAVLNIPTGRAWP
ncbi:YfiR family protein [Massilia sp. B-10]|nr:YfiR family protein [Massilia sp. B-10]UUZ54543.1 YfiR family protein [Massilia sp. H-1]